MARVLLDSGVSRKWHSICLRSTLTDKLNVGIVRLPRPSSSLPLLSYDLFRERRKSDRSDALAFS